MNGKRAKELRAAALDKCIRTGIPLDTAYDPRVMKTEYWPVIAPDGTTITDETTGQPMTMRHDKVTIYLGPCLRRVYQRAKRAMA